MNGPTTMNPQSLLLVKHTHLKVLKWEDNINSESVLRMKPASLIVPCQLNLSGVVNHWKKLKKKQLKVKKVLKPSKVKKALLKVPVKVLDNNSKSSVLIHHVVTLLPLTVLTLKADTVVHQHHQDQSHGPRPLVNMLKSHGCHHPNQGENNLHIISKSKSSELESGNSVTRQPLSLLITLLMNLNKAKNTFSVSVL